MPAEQAMLFGDYLGNCSQSLEHRGPITLDAASVPQYADSADDSAFPTAGNALDIAPGSMIRGAAAGTGVNISRPSVFWWDGIVKLMNAVIFGVNGAVQFFGNGFIFGPWVVGPGGSITYTTTPTMAQWLTAQPVGRIIIWDISLDGAIPTGWSAYATDAKYLKINNSAQGGTGGNATHDHGGNTNNATTGLTIGDHPGHGHPFGTNLTLHNYTAAGAQAAYFVDAVPITTDAVTLSHSGLVSEGSGHSHVIPSANNDPVYFEILLIKKVS